MEKIKLNILGDLVEIRIPSTTNIEIIEKQLEDIVRKNYKLLRILKFYKIIILNGNGSQILQLEKIIESIINLKPLKKIDKSNERLKKNSDYKFHYGNLKSGEKINSESNVIILGNLNPGSYVKSEKNIFVYGKACGTLYAGCDFNRHQDTYIYAEETENLKIRIENIQFMYDDKESHKNILFQKKMEKITTKKLNEIQIKELMKKIGLVLI